MNFDRNELLRRVADALDRMDYSVLTDTDLRYLMRSLETAIESQETNPLYRATKRNKPRPEKPSRRLHSV